MSPAATRPGPALCAHDRRRRARPQVWNAAQLRDALKDLPDDAPVPIGVADDPGGLDGYRDFVLVDAHQVENVWPATPTAPERTETAQALTLFADREPGAYDLLDRNSTHSAPSRQQKGRAGSGGAGSCAPAVEEVGQGAGLLFLAGDLLGENVAVDVRGDGGEDQALELGRFQRLHLPLHWVCRIQVRSGRRRPAISGRHPCPGPRAARARWSLWGVYRPRASEASAVPPYAGFGLREGQVP